MKEGDCDRPNGSRVLLVDLDNCPNAVVELGAELETFTEIIGCYAGREPTIILSHVPVWARMLEKGRCEIVAMRVGKNASDFGLAFWAGRLLESLPDSTEFVVLSRDKDLDRVVELLRKYGRSASRLAVEGRSDEKNSLKNDEKSSLKNDEKNSSKKGTVLKQTALAFMDTLSPSGPKPVKKEAIRNHVKNFLKGKKIAADADKVIEVLLSEGLIKINGSQKVSYSFHRLIEANEGR